jgi:integrase
MAGTTRRTWTDPQGRRRRAWGYTLQHEGRQVRVAREEWTRQDAEEALRAFRAAPPSPPPPPAMTLGGAVDRFLTVKHAKRSLHEDRRLLRAAVAYFEGRTPLPALTGARIAAFKESLLARRAPGSSGARIAPATVNRHLAALRTLLRLAHREWETLAAVPRITLEREPEGRLRFLSEDEILRLLAAADASKNPFLGAIVRLALHTGMRKSEILSLAWERVDFGRGVLQVERTKSGRRREVPMNQAVYEVLAALSGPKVEGYVFRRADGGEWGQIRTAFAVALRRAQIADFRFHDLRHTFASWLVIRGRPLKEVQELLGHRTFAMTLRYAHLAPERLREAVEVLDGLGAVPAKMTPSVSTWSAHGVQSEGAVSRKPLSRP